MLSQRRLTGVDPSLPVYVIDNGDLQLAFLPSVGGRLLSVRSGGMEFLWQNPRFFDASLRSVRPRATWPLLDGTMASWANVGGEKTWPAPQGWGGAGEWAGPPDPVIDSGQWQFDAASTSGGNGRTVTMMSPPDARTGLQVRREFNVPESGHTFWQRSVFTNVSSKPVLWALWEVCQVDTAAAYNQTGVVAHIDVSVDDDVPPLSLGSYRGQREVEPVLDGSVRVHLVKGVQKLGFASASGRVAYVRSDGAALSLQFSPEMDGTYPDDGSRVELWLQSPQDRPIASLGGLLPDTHLAELEVLSPLRSIKPGENAELTTLWNARGPK